jgi:hypothetical protein
MVQGPSDADTSSDDQEINLILRNPKVYYHVDISPLPDPFLIKDDSNLYLQEYFFTTNFNIILRSMPKHSKWCPTLRYSKILYIFLISVMRNIRVCHVYLNFQPMMFGEPCTV